jgi:hypothetical protein
MRNARKEKKIYLWCYVSSNVIKKRVAMRKDEDARINKKKKIYPWCYVRSNVIKNARKQLIKAKEWRLTLINLKTRLTLRI